MPTYNDEKYIQTAINSVISQDYPDWELIIIDDGSTDNTSEVIKGYEHKKIVYVYQENSGQLNALIKGSSYITGDIVCLLHSDDNFINNNVLNRVIIEFENDPNLQSVYGDMIRINKDGEIQGTIKLIKFNKKRIRNKLFLTFGSNPLIDHFVARSDIFKEQIYKNYLLNNTVYFMDYSNCEPINMKKIDPWYCYRVFDENYINSKIGQFVVLNGKLRTTSLLLKSGLQVTKLRLLSPVIFKFCNKILGFNAYKGKSNPYFSQKFLQLWYLILKKQNYSSFALDTLKAAIRSYSSNTGDVYTINSSGFILYEGKDARTFYKHNTDGKLDQLYKDLIYNNISYISVPTEEIKTKVEKALFFLSLDFRIIVK